MTKYTCSDGKFSVQTGDILYIVQLPKAIIGKVCYADTSGFDILEYEHLIKYKLNNNINIKWTKRPAITVDRVKNKFTPRYTEKNTQMFRRVNLSEKFLYLMSCSNIKGIEQYFKN